MFHTERVHAQRKLYPKHPTLQNQLMIPQHASFKRNKSKSSAHRNRKMTTSSSPFVNIKKDVLCKPHFKTSTQSLAMTRGLKTHHQTTMNFQNQTQLQLPSAENDSKSHPLSLFLKLNSTSRPFAIKQSLENSARNKFMELTSERKKQVSVSVAPREHSQEVRKFLDEQQMGEYRKKIGAKGVKPWGRYFIKATESSKGDTVRMSEENSEIDAGKSRIYKHEFRKEESKKVEPVRPIYDLFKIKNRDSEVEPFMVEEREKKATIESQKIRDKQQQQKQRQREKQREKQKQRVQHRQEQRQQQRQRQLERQKYRQEQHQRQLQRQRQQRQKQQKQRQRQRERERQREKQLQRQRQKQKQRQIQKQIQLQQQARRQKQSQQQQKQQSTKPQMNTPFIKQKQSNKDPFKAQSVHSQATNQQVSVTSARKPTVDISQILSSKFKSNSVSEVKPVLYTNIGEDINSMLEKVRPFTNNIDEIDMSPIHHQPHGVNIRKIVSERSHEMFDDFDDDIENIILEKPTVKQQDKKKEEEEKKQKDIEKAKQKEKELERYKQQVQQKERQRLQNQRMEKQKALKKQKQQQLTKQSSKKQPKKPETLAINKQQSSSQPQKSAPQQSQPSQQPQTSEDLYLDYIQKHLDLVDSLGEYFKIARQTYANIDYAWQVNSFWLYKKFAYQRQRVYLALKGGENCFSLEGISIQDSTLNELIQLQAITEYAEELQEQAKQIKQGLIERNKKASKIHAKLKGEMDLSVDPYTECIKCLGDQFNFLTKILQSQPNNKGLYSRVVYVCQLIFIIENLHGNFIKEWEQHNQAQIDVLKSYLSKHKGSVEKIIRKG